MLDDASRESLVDRTRAPLGLLVATGLAAGYHFAVWRHDRVLTAAAAPARKRTVGKVILVTAGDPDAMARAAAEATGASVTVWRKADGGAPDDTEGAAPADGAADELADLLARALDGVSADRVLVVMGPGSRVEVIPLASA
jgi:hypothetical protein